MDHMCRICSESKSQKFDVFLSKVADHSLAYLINRYLHLKIEKEDTFSHLICGLCVKRIAHVHTFAQLAAETQEIFVLLAAKEKARMPISKADEKNEKNIALLANEKNIEKSATLAPKKRVNSSPKNVENVKLLNKRPSQRKEVQERTKSILPPDGKEKVMLVKVPKSLNSANNSEIKNIDERHREEDGTTNDETAVEEEKKSFSYYKLNSSCLLISKFNRSNNNEATGKKSVIKTEMKESKVARKLNDTLKEKQCDVKCNFPPKRFFGEMGMKNDLNIYSQYGPQKYPRYNLGYTVDHLDLSGQLSRNTYQCDICKKVFLHKSTLSVHMCLHSDIKRYTCKVCKMGFIRKYRFDEHFRLKHLGEIPYKCKICEKTFMTKQSFDNHFYQHEGTKPHECPVCRKTFSWKKSLRRHIINTHKNVKRFKCDICNKCLSEKWNLKRHIQSHLNMLEKPFRCKRCDKRFPHVGELRKHMRTQRHQFEVACFL